MRFLGLYKTSEIFYILREVLTDFSDFSEFWWLVETSETFQMFSDFFCAAAGAKAGASSYRHCNGISAYIGQRAQVQFTIKYFIFSIWVVMDNQKSLITIWRSVIESNGRENYTTIPIGQYTQWGHGFGCGSVTEKSRKTLEGHKSLEKSQELSEIWKVSKILAESEKSLWSLENLLESILKNQFSSPLDLNRLSRLQRLSIYVYIHKSRKKNEYNLYTSAVFSCIQYSDIVCVTEMKQRLFKFRRI